MYSIVFGEGETSVQVFLQEWGLVLLDVLNELVVNGGLELCTVGGNFLLLSTFLEEASATGLLLVGSEGFVVDSIQFDSSGADLGGCGNGVNLVDASKWNTVDSAWPAHQEQTGLELLEEYDSLSAESARGKDENAASLNSFSELGCIGFLSAALSRFFLGGVPIEFFDH